MDHKYAKLFAGAATVALAATSFGTVAVAQDDGFTIGVSNNVQGNGWREEMICSIKAQALASGEVAELNIAHRNTDSAGQLEDARHEVTVDGRTDHEGQRPSAACEARDSRRRTLGRSSAARNSDRSSSSRSPP